MLRRNLQKNNLFTSVLSKYKYEQMFNKITKNRQTYKKNLGILYICPTKPKYLRYVLL